jgi:hypothetical protein
MPTPPRLVLRLALAALLTPASALGAEATPAVQPPLVPAAAPAAAPEPPPIPVVKGSVVRVDLSRVPQRVGHRGSATCAATRIDATGTVQPLECQQPITFDGPFSGRPVVLVFQPGGGGAATRHEYALEWDPRPRAFTTPSAGVLRQPRPEGQAAGPVPVPAPVMARARQAAEVACGRCPPPARYALRDVKVESPEATGSAVTITVLPPGSRP